jgi:hypothetical protein
MHYNGDWKMTNAEMREFFEKGTTETSLRHLFACVFYYAFLSPITLLYGSLETGVNMHIEGISFVASTILAGFVVLTLTYLVKNFYEFREQAIAQRKEDEQPPVPKSNLPTPVPYYVQPAVITFIPASMDPDAPAILGSVFTGIIVSVLQTCLSLYSAYLATLMIVSFFAS